MPVSPSAQSDGPLRLSVSCDGAAQEAISVISATIQTALNRIPRAELIIVDGDMPEGQFPVSDGASFAPGSAISISAGYGDAETPLFSGIVVRHGIRIGGDNVSRLIVECRDLATKMTLGRKNANYIDQKDSDVITTLIGNHGLTAEVAATTTQHRELVQYYCSDWDFVLARAEANGLLVNVAAAKVKVKAPEVGAAAVLSVTWGNDLFAFDADVDARDQWTSAQATAWDPKTQAIVWAMPPSRPPSTPRATWTVPPWQRSPAPPPTSCRPPRPWSRPTSPTGPRLHN
jgi:phage protein D